MRSPGPHGGADAAAVPVPGQGHVDAAPWAHQEPTVNTFGPNEKVVVTMALAILAEIPDLTRDPLSCADRLDWPAKLRLLEGYRERDGLTWDAPRLQLVDLQYADVRMGKGLYNRLATRGSIKRLVTADRHPRLLPWPLPGALPHAGRGRVLGLGDLRSGPRVAGAHPHPGADAGHPPARRRAHRRLAHRGGAGGGAHARLSTRPWAG